MVTRRIVLQNVGMLYRKQQTQVRQGMHSHKPRQVGAVEDSNQLEATGTLKIGSGNKSWDQVTHKCSIKKKKTPPEGNKECTCAAPSSGQYGVQQDTQFP